MSRLRDKYTERNSHYKRADTAQNAALARSGAFLDILGPGATVPFGGPSYGVGGEQSEPKQLGALGGAVGSHPSRENF